MTEKNAQSAGTYSDSDSNDMLLKLLLDGYRDGVFAVKDLIPGADVLLPKDNQKGTPLLEL